MLNGLGNKGAHAQMRNPAAMRFSSQKDTEKGRKGHAKHPQAHQPQHQKTTTQNTNTKRTYHDELVGLDALLERRLDQVGLDLHGRVGLGEPGLDGLGGGAVAFLEGDDGLLNEVKGGLGGGDGGHFGVCLGLWFVVGVVWG